MDSSPVPNGSAYAELDTPDEVTTRNEQKRGAEPAEHGLLSLPGAAESELTPARLRMILFLAVLSWGVIAVAIAGIVAKL